AHPRLQGPPEFLKALAKAKPDIYKQMQSQNWFGAVALVHAVEGVPRDRIDPFLAAARKKVAAGITNVHQDTHLALTEVALTYDAFYDAIPPEERRAWIEWLNAHLAAYTSDEGAFHNSTLSKAQCYLQVAYATMGENPRAGEFRDYALKKLHEGLILPVILEFGAGGGFTECGWYTRGSLWNLVQALEMARRFEGYDGFAKAPRFYYQRLAYEMLQPYPGFGEYGAEHYAVEGDGANTYGGHTEYPRFTRTVLANYFRGSDLSRFIEGKRRKGSNPQARLMDFLYEEDPQPVLPIATFPLAHMATGIGKVYARSDWTDDATWLRFECGDYWNNHQHLEVGNFEIYRYAPLATESGEYQDYVDSHSVNWLTRTIAHNSILIFQGDETWKQLRDGGRNPYANDGGQNLRGAWPAQNLTDWKAKRDAYERGDIVAYENRPEFLYVAGDCTRAYNPSKLSLWVRQIVFLRPGTFVIFDRVVTTRPEYEKTWVLHSHGQPQVEGTSVTITNGKGRLAVQTLLPEKPVLRTVEGYTYRGQTFNPRPSGQTPLAHKWRTEVLPPSPQTGDLFLHVLQTDAPQPAQLVRKGAQVGVRVGEAEVLFTGNVGGTLTVGGKATPLAPGVKTGKYE
ncbi:MAG: heparinase II/III family protein, partial [Planctomycetes bacterium]|nr:heparinase II/III family protein [Planctomycetota bacterium]